MKVSLKNKQKDCTAYGLKFDGKGVCECDKKTVQSLIDSGVVVEVKAAKKDSK